jgi:hypothetical protein
MAAAYAGPIKQATINLEARAFPEFHYAYAKLPLLS